MREFPNSADVQKLVKSTARSNNASWCLASLSLALFSPGCSEQAQGTLQDKTTSLSSNDVSDARSGAGHQYSRNDVEHIVTKLYTILDLYDSKNPSETLVAEIQLGIAELLDAYRAHCPNEYSSGNPELLIKIDALSLELFQHPNLPQDLQAFMLQEFIDRLQTSYGGEVDVRRSCLRTLYAATWSVEFADRLPAIDAFGTAFEADKQRLLSYDDQNATVAEYGNMQMLTENLGWMCEAMHTLSFSLPAPLSDSLTHRCNFTKLKGAICESPSFITRQGQVYWLMEALEHIELNPYLPSTIVKSANQVFFELAQTQEELLDGLDNVQPLLGSISEVLTKIQPKDRATIVAMTRSDLSGHLRNRINLLRAVTNGENRSEVMSGENFSRLLKVLENDRGLDAHFDYLVARVMSVLILDGFDHGYKPNAKEISLLLGCMTPESTDSPKLRNCKVYTSAKLVAAGISEFRQIFTEAEVWAYTPDQ